MSLRDWALSATALVNLGLAILSLLRGRGIRLARVLCAYALVTFGWTVSVVSAHITGESAFTHLDRALTVIAPALVLHIVVAFVGRSRELRPVLVLGYVGFGSLAATSILATVSVDVLDWVQSKKWTIAFLAGWLPSVFFATLLLIRHLARTSDLAEKARARLLGAALLIGVAFLLTDLTRDLGLDLPPLGAYGLLASTILLTIVVHRFRLFKRELDRATWLFAAVIAITAVVVYALVLAVLHSNLGAMFLGLLIVTSGLLAIVREASFSIARAREKTERLAAFGRISQQMAHDLKNPLAALIGAAQLLEGEQTNNAESERYRKLVFEQAQRIRTIIERYEKVAQIVPVFSSTSINEIVRHVVQAQTLTAAPGVQVHLQLDDNLGPFEADPDLVATAIENLLRNSIDATKTGSITISTRQEGKAVIEIRDSGEGVDVRDLERVFDDFFTTKTNGSGLGLAFVRRVALAHGGDAQIESTRGVGTTVTLSLARDRR